MFTSLLATLLHLTLTFASQSPLNVQSHSKPQNIAIIGAGAAGSSTAYHLTRFSHHPLNITIFESSHLIGGRTTTINALKDPRYPTELGGSIFVRINQILYNASQSFNLATSSPSLTQPSLYDLGIWDGNSLVFTLPNRPSTPGGTLGEYWDIAKLFFKYGLAPLRVRRLQQATISKFLKLYDEEFPFDLNEVIRDVGLLEVLNQTGRELVRAGGVSDAFAREIVQASTRVNYAQNLDLHGLETMVCMSTDGAMAVEGGNWRIFDEMVRRSGARVVFNTTIEEIRMEAVGSSSNCLDSALESNAEMKHDTGVMHDADLKRNTEVDGNEGSEQRISLLTDTHKFEDFDTVILSAPFKNIKISPQPSQLPDVPEYVSLYVTLFTSPHRPDPRYFGLKAGEEANLPDSILTTVPIELDGLLGRGEEGVGPTGFWSLSTLRTLDPRYDGYIPEYLDGGHIPGENLEMEKQYLYKIFSPKKLDAEDLMEIFGWEVEFDERDESRIGDKREDQGDGVVAEDYVDDEKDEIHIDGKTHIYNHEKHMAGEEVKQYLSEAQKQDTTKGQDHRDSKHVREKHNITDLPQEFITWSHEKRWDSYPYLPPTDSFDCFDIYCRDDNLAGKVWYTSGIEKFISTMETSALSGRNVARLIVDEMERRDVLLT